MTLLAREEYMGQVRAYDILKFIRGKNNFSQGLVTQKLASNSAAGSEMLTETFMKKGVPGQTCDEGPGIFSKVLLSI